MHVHVFFFNDTANPEINPLSLPDALPISVPFCSFAVLGWKDSSNKILLDIVEHILETNKKKKGAYIHRVQSFLKAMGD